MALEGAAFGLWPIIWIVINAIWIYNMTVDTGHFVVLRRSFARISDDQRIQAIIIAFCFGALLEALAGFGTPVAITAVMLIALGFEPMKAATVALVANTAPVAFGAIAIPIVTLSAVTGCPRTTWARWSGARHRCSPLIVPLILVGMVDGMRGIRQVWPAASSAGLPSGWPSSCARTTCPSSSPTSWRRWSRPRRSCGLVRVWHPSEPMIGTGSPVRAAIAGGATHDPAFEESVRRRRNATHDTGAEVLAAYLPYVIIIAVFSIAQIGVIKDCARVGHHRVSVARAATSPTRTVSRWAR